MPNANFKSPAALFRFFGVCVIGLALDLFTKVLAVQHWKDNFPSEFIPRWLQFTYTENRGAVFGIGQGQRWIFVAVSVVAIGFLSCLFATTHHRQRLYQVLLGMLLAGVLGNMFDRIAFGYVRDMIHALPGFHWPGTWHIGPYPPVDREIFPYVFNVADMLLCVGVFCMITYSLVNPQRAETVDTESDSQTR